MSPKGPGWGKFTQTMANHVLGHKNLNKSSAIVNTKVFTHKLRRDLAGSGPGFNRFAFLTLTSHNPF
jgi:hypothetical protein